MYHSKSPKKDAILEWAKNLEKVQLRGKYKHSITNISTTIRHELKEMHLEGAIHYAFEILPHIYKNPRFTHNELSELQSTVRVDEPPEDSSILLADDCTRINQTTLARIEKTQRCLQEFSKRLKKDLPFEMDIPEETMTEIMIRWDAVIDHFEQALDKREKITPSTHHLLFYAGTTQTLSDVYKVYVKYVKEFSTVTPKQVGKILKGRTKKIIELYEPKNQHEAMEMGFYGSECKECGSFRMEYRQMSDGKKAYCFKCGFHQDPNTESYYNE